MFGPWAGKIPWRRKWQSTLVFLPGESHGQRSLAGCSPWGHKEWDTAHTHTHTRCHILHTEYNYVIYSASYLSVIVYYPMFHSDN